jgi:hypothetical protein
VRQPSRDPRARERLARGHGHARQELTERDAALDPERHEALRVRGSQTPHRHTRVRHERHLERAVAVHVAARDREHLALGVFRLRDLRLFEREGRQKRAHLGVHRGLRERVGLGRGRRIFQSFPTVVDHRIHVDDHTHLAALELGLDEHERRRAPREPTRHAERRRFVVRTNPEPTREHLRHARRELVPSCEGLGALHGRRDDERTTRHRREPLSCPLGEQRERRELRARRGLVGLGRSRERHGREGQAHGEQRATGQGHDRGTIAQHERVATLHAGVTTASYSSSTERRAPMAGSSATSPATLVTSVQLPEG